MLLFWIFYASKDSEKKHGIMVSTKIFSSTPVFNITAVHSILASQE